MEDNNLNTCCFFGHRKIDLTDKLLIRPYQPKRGIKLAFNYARRKAIKIINLLEIKP